MDFDERKYLEEKRLYEIYRKNRIYTLSGIILAVFGLSSILVKELLMNFVNAEISITTIAIGSISLAMGSGLLLFRYLQVGQIKKLYSPSDYDSGYKKELEEIRLELIKLKKKNGSFNDTENLNEVINNIVSNTMTEDFIQSKIDTAYSDKAIEQSKIRQLNEGFEELTFRIDSELSRLRRSANLNLVIGTLTTSIAVAALGFEVFMSELDIKETVNLLSHYLPRLSLVVFIEIFAFFFLKLYKANLQDIKYFNNEKTNIDFKLIALKTAIYQDNKELIKSMIEELVKTERNFILKKDESTVELEKLRSDKENNKLLAQILSKLTDKL